MPEEPYNYTILVVEDDLPVLNALTDKLAREGYTVLQAKDGEEGLAAANQYHPDLILLDIIMPKLSGLSVMKKLRTKGEWGKSVPIILLTNVSPDEQEIRKSVMENEPVHYLIKTDWSIHDVVEMVRERLNKL